MSTAKRKIHKFDFSNDEAHVALVDKAANMQEVLVMKAAEPEVRITTSMRTFLEKFFNLWGDDSRILAGILGYSTEYDWEDDESYEDYIQSKVDQVVLLKGKTISDTLPESIVKKVKEIQKSFKDTLKTSGATSLEDYIKNVKGASTLDKTEISTEELNVLKSTAAQIEELKKQLEQAEVYKAQVAELQKAMLQKQRNDMVELVKGYSFITEDAQEKVVDFLIKSEGSDIVLQAFEKARDAITAAVVDTEKGATGGDLEVETSEIEKSNSIVSKLLKSRKA